MISRKKEMMGQVTVYVSGAVLTQVVTVVAAVLMRRFLGPVQMGVWATLQIILTYSTYCTLGSLKAAHFEIPFANGKGDAGRADAVKNAVFSFSFLTAGLLAASIVLAAWVLRARISAEVFYGLQIIAALVVLQRINDASVGLLRAYKLFSLASKQVVWSSIVNTLLVLGLTYSFQIYGFMIAFGLSLLFNILFVHHYHRYRIRWNLDPGVIGGLIKMGAPLLIIGFFTNSFLIVDKLVIAKWLGFEMVGLYSVSIMATQYLATFPTAVSAILVPYFVEQYGKREVKHDLSNDLRAATLAFSNSMPVLIAGIWFFGPPLVELVLPDFVACVPSLRWLVVGAYFGALTQPFEIFLISVKKHNVLMPLLVFALAVAFLLDVWAVRSGWGITGVAVATLVAMALRFVLTYAFAASRIWDAPRVAKGLAALLGKGGYVIVCLLSIERWVVLESPAAGAAVKFALFVLLNAPFLIVLFREFDVVAALRRKKGVLENPLPETTA